MLWYRMLPKDCSLLAGSVCRICRHCSSQATTSLWNRTAPRHRSVALTSVCRDISCCSNNLAQAGIVTDEDEAEDDVGRGVLMGKEPWCGPLPSLVFTAPVIPDRRCEAGWKGSIKALL